MLSRIVVSAPTVVADDGCIANVAVTLSSAVVLMEAVVLIPPPLFMLAKTVPPPFCICNKSADCPEAPRTVKGTVAVEKGVKVALFCEVMLPIKVVLPTEFIVTGKQIGRAHV